MTNCEDEVKDTGQVFSDNVKIFVLSVFLKDSKMYAWILNQHKTWSSILDSSLSCPLDIIWAPPIEHAGLQ